MGRNKSLNTESVLTLAFDTSGRVGSVAVGLGNEILHNQAFSGQMKHSTELFSLILELLRGIDKSPADVEQVYFTAGPGSFTGLRIGVTLAKMMHLAKNSVKIVALNTLDALAINADNSDCERICTILDAKRGLFFAAGYQKKAGKWHNFFDAQLLNSEQILELIGTEQIFLLGEGLVYYKDNFKEPNISFLDEQMWAVRAENVYKVGLEKAKNGEFTDALALMPNYLRGAEAKVKTRF